MQSEREKRIWKELNKDGIYNEAELDKAIKNMKPLNIGGFVNKVGGDSILIHNKGGPVEAPVEE